MKQRAIGKIKKFIQISKPLPCIFYSATNIIKLWRECLGWSTILIALTCSTRFETSCSSPIHELKEFTIHKMNKSKRCFMHAARATGHSPCRDRIFFIWCYIPWRRNEKANKQTNKLTRRFLVSIHYAKHTTVIFSTEVLSRLWISSKRIYFLFSSLFCSWCFNL